MAGHINGFVERYGRDFASPHLQTALFNDFPGRFRFDFQNNSARRGGNLQRFTGLKTRRVPDLARQNNPVLLVRLNDRIHGTSMARKWHVGNWKSLRLQPRLAPIRMKRPAKTQGKPYEQIVF